MDLEIGHLLDIIVIIKAWLCPHLGVVKEWISSKIDVAVFKEWLFFRLDSLKELTLSSVDLGSLRALLTRIELASIRNRLPRVEFGAFKHWLATHIQLAVIKDWLTSHISINALKQLPFPRIGIASFKHWLPSHVDIPTLQEWFSSRIDVDTLKQHISNLDRDAITTWFHSHLLFDTTILGTPAYRYILAIVPLLGANLVNKATGRLVRSPYMDFLPLPAAQVLATDQVSWQLPGFKLYNITDGVASTRLSPWSARWLSCQKLSTHGTAILMQAQDKRSKRGVHEWLGLLMDILWLVAFIMGPYRHSYETDSWPLRLFWAGLIVSIITKSYLLSSMTETVTRMTGLACRRSDFTKPAKLLVSLPAGKMITVITTRGIAKKCLLTEPDACREPYYASRTLIGVGLVLQIVTSPLVPLPMQLFYVASLFLAWIFTVSRIGCDEYQVGKYLKIRKGKDKTMDRREKIYAKLRLTEDEERKMIEWSLVPDQSDMEWWSRYRDLRTSYARVNGHEGV